MRGIQFLFLLIITNLTFGQTKIVLPEPYGDNFIESELITEVTFISLLAERYGMILPDMELKVDNDDYFILDNRNAQCVYHFDAVGEMLNTICEVKNTNEGENVPDLSNPVKFSVNPYKRQVEIYNFENSEILRFGYDGSPAGKISMGIGFSDFQRDVDGNYWLYMGWHNSETQYRLYKTDEGGNVIERKMRLPSNSIPFEGFAFYPYQENILMCEVLGNTVYSIKKNEVLPKYLFDFGSHNLPMNYHVMKGDDSYRLISEAGYYTVKKYIENNNFAYLFLNYSSKEQREMLHVIHDKRAGQVFVYTENSAIGAFDKAQAITDNDELVFLVSPRKVRQLLSGGTEFVPAPFMSLVEDLGRERNPVILKIKLQSLSFEVPETESADSLYFNN